ncbi:hypothetical protein R1flu_024105 [Riccia fluitans]|uniref:NAD-dependent epimerase/dehydratase domain-containing protein n=1 Tax=Riccia fluitans TaxID=41844 RepID=A0ABD1XTX6_9MARC
MGRSSPAGKTNWGICRSAQLLNKAVLLLLGLMLLVVALKSFFGVRIEDVTRDLFHASERALGPQIHRYETAMEMGTKPWHNGTWVTRVIQSGCPTRAGGYSVLVTGAAGFIGSFVSQAMVAKGWGVVGLDNFNDNYDPLLKFQREKLMQKNGRIFVVHGDINDEELVKALFEILSFTHVLHLAAAEEGVTADAKGWGSPLSSVRNDIAGLVTLLGACTRASSQPIFVWASSSSVYGLNNGALCSEVDRTDQPNSFYGATKKTGEQILHPYSSLYGLSVTILRLFPVYGPYGRPDAMIPELIESILSGKPIRSMNNGSIKVAVDLSYIDDIVNGIIAALETAPKSKGSNSCSTGKKMLKHQPLRQADQYRVFNLGSGQSVSIDEVITLLEKYLGIKAIRHHDRCQSIEEEEDGLSIDVQPYTRVANLTLAEKYLGYHPKTGFSQGLEKFVFWYHTHRDGERLVQRHFINPSSRFTNLILQL